MKKHTKVVWSEADVVSRNLFFLFSSSLYIIYVFIYYKSYKRNNKNIKKRTHQGGVDKPQHK